MHLDGTWNWFLWSLLVAFVYMNLGYLLMLLHLRLARKSTFREGNFHFHVSWKTLLFFPGTTIFNLGSPWQLLYGNDIKVDKTNSPMAFNATITQNNLIYKIPSTIFWPCRIVWLIFLVVVVGLTIGVWKVFTLPVRWIDKS